MANNEKIASRAFRDALHGKEIKDLEQVKRISRLEDPQNWVTLARAALVHGGHIPASDFEPLLDTTSREFGSQLYDYSWSLCTYATIKTERVIEAYTAMLAAAALCLCPAEEIELQNKQDRGNRRDRQPWAGYRGPISMMPGNRMIWEPGKAHLYAERSLAGPLAAWALDGRRWDWKEWDHHALGWAMDAAYPFTTPKGHQHGHRIELSRDPVALVRHIDKLKMRRGQRLDILLLAGGGIFGLLKQSTHNTRGSALVTEYVPDEKLFRLISPAQRGQHGEWTRCEAELKDDFRWEVREVNGSGKIHGEVAEPETHIIWDEEGCRIVGQAEDPLPDPIPELEPAGALYDSALSQLGSQGHSDSADREARGRTAFEVMNRIASAERSSAREGVETLLADMKAQGW